MKSTLLPNIISAALLLCAAPLTTYGVTVVVDGTNSNVTFNADDGIGGSVPSIIDGTVMDAQSSFSKEIISVGDTVTPVVSSAFQISTVPVVSAGGSNHFRLVYDSQETGGSGKHHIDINVLRLYANASDSASIPSAGTLVWDLDVGNVISVNPTDDGTNTPQGNGADFALLVPISAFVGLNTDNYLYLETRQTDSDNGNDEWVLGDAGATLPPSTVITPGTNPIPEPSTVLLLGMSGLWMISRRRRREE